MSFDRNLMILRGFGGYKHTSFGRNWMVLKVSESTQLAVQASAPQKHEHFSLSSAPLPPRTDPRTHLSVESY